VASGLVACAATSHAQTKPAEVTTIAPPVQLSGDQLQAIAAKSALAALHAAAPVHSIPSWKPAAATKSTPPARVVPTPRVMGAESAPPTRIPQFEWPAGKMKPVDSEPARANTFPGGFDPFLVKRDEIAVIGGRIVLIPHSAVTPEKGRAGR
jgi:hypothetical protein